MILLWAGFGVLVIAKLIFVADAALLVDGAGDPSEMLVLAGVTLLIGVLTITLGNANVLLARVLLIPARSPIRQ